MRKVEAVEVTRVIDQVTSVTCDICGKEIEGSNHGWDGFTFSHRPSEEDEITINARDICWECFEDDDLHERIQRLAMAIMDIAPYAEIIFGPALGDDFFDMLRNSVDTPIETE